MSAAITAGAYAEWIATLTGSDLAAALAAGLDQPPSDEHSKYARSGSEVREYDGLPVFLKNKSVHPLQHEATRDHTIEQVEDYDIAKDTIVPDLAAALRRVLAFVIRGMGPEEIFTHSRTIAQRVFIVCRAIQLGDCEKPTLAEIADAVGFSRASLSKVGVEFRDAIGNEHLHFGGREQARKTMSESARRAWKRRRSASDQR
jgi:hypothetical protein